MELETEGIHSELEDGVLSLETEVGASIGTYEQLPDKPKINGITLVGNKASEELGIPRLNAYTSLRKVADFLYEAEYDTLDYIYAYEHFRNTATIALGGCSVIGAGNLVGRNYDWRYNRDAAFIVRTAEAQGRRSVVGIAGSVPGLTINEVDSRIYNDMYRVMPFYLQDGVNNAGLFAEINVVPTLHNAPTIPLIQKRDSVSVVMLVRYILDRFESVDTSVAYLRDYVEIYVPTALDMMGYEAHFFLKDATKSVELEIVDGEIVTIETDKATNFHLCGVEFNADGSVYTNADVADGHLPTEQFIDTYGSGLERWNILNDATITDIASLQAVMRSVNFSKAYTELTDVWLSEFVGGSISVDTPADDTALAARLAEYRQKWAERSRDTAEVWNTCHSAVYDLNAKMLLVSVQEIDTWYSATQGGIPQRIEDLEASVEAIETKIQIPVRTAIPEGGLLPNVFYRLGTISEPIVITLVPTSDTEHYYEYMMEFVADTTDITFDSNVTGWLGDMTPEFVVGRLYQISILNGIGCYGEVKE